MVENNYPRTLIVGVSFSNSSGAGTFLSALFTGWPPDQIAVADRTSNPLDWTKCARNYCLGDREYRWSNLLRRWAPPRPSGPLNPQAHVSGSNYGVGSQKAEPRSRRSHLRRSLWQAVVALSGGIEPFLRAGSSPEFIAWAQVFNPEVIYGRCGDLNSVRLLAQLKRALGIPLVVHLMDDWVSNAYSSGLFAPYLKKRFRAEFRDLVVGAEAVIGIGTEMSEAYKRLYGREILTLQNPVDLKAYINQSRIEWATGKPFRIRYGGRIGWSIHTSVLGICAAVDKLRREGHDVLFDIYTFQHAEFSRECKCFTGVTVHPPQPIEDLPRSQAEVDLLVVCYDFDPRSIKMARYSMPGKIAECMVSGTPILVYGARGLPIVEYALREQWGIVVSDDSPDSLQLALIQVIEDAALRERVGQRAKLLAVTRHDSKAVALELRNILNTVIDPANIHSSTNIQSEMPYKV